ncbi:putative secreted protein [Candidatus Protofrankia californiensis]|uniref:Putative secreted protein n=1 Tax=Candidatus Protofrankia californiensis TaxID=1839754 RepID=A0A1C3NZI5_9ACTN|nr:putative secreted protein [Candidatus Protofrankia californiensis]
MFQRTTLLALPVSLVLGLAACSDDSTTDTTTTSPGHPASSSTAAPTALPEGVIEQYRTLAKEIRSEGGEVQTGPWRIAYIVEPAESWYEGSSGQQVLRKPPAGETHHVEGHTPALASGATATFTDVALKR